MTHERGKSDPAIVAAKPTNKAGRPAAEPVERRAGAEGNADQQSTLRTQSRERVTQALGRVRHAARQAKKARFNLDEAYPEPPLLPADPQARAWVRGLGHDLQPLARPLSASHARLQHLHGHPGFCRCPPVKNQGPEVIFALMPNALPSVEQAAQKDHCCDWRQRAGGGGAIACASGP